MERRITDFEYFFVSAEHNARTVRLEKQRVKEAAQKRRLEVFQLCVVVRFLRISPSVFAEICPYSRIAQELFATLSYT